MLSKKWEVIRFHIIDQNSQKVTLSGRGYGAVLV